MDVAEAQHLMDGLDWQGAVKDIQASVQWLKANGSQKVSYLLFMHVLSFISVEPCVDSIRIGHRHCS